MKLVFHALVEDDLNDAVDWYESRRESLGEEFLLSLYKSFALIENKPTIFQIKYFDFRICLIDRFPYSIHYTVIDEDTIFVSGVWYASANPAWWLRRV